MKVLNIGRFYLFFFLGASSWGALPALAAHSRFIPPSSSRFHVVIDPGHGGSDFGTIFNNGRIRIAEKDVALLLSKQLARELRSRGILVTLTRNSDREVPLGNRTALANRLKADAFLSIHLNSPARPSSSDAQGIETFILNNTTDETSRRLARLENTVLGPRSAAADTPEQTDVALILRDLTLDANLAESKRLACGIQGNLVRTPLGRGKIRDRGIKQALFHVLLGAEMPSALLEAGFLTHPQDRKLFLSAPGRRFFSNSVANAIDRFRRTRGTPEALRELSRCQVAEQIRPQARHSPLLSAE